MYAQNIAKEDGSFLMPIEVLDDNGKPTGNLAMDYDNLTGTHFQTDCNALYTELQNEDSPFQFIYTKGDLKESLNLYMDRAKGELTLDPTTGKTRKGDRWYTNAAKLDKGDVTAEAVDINDPDYNPASPYRQVTTYSTHYQDNIPQLRAQLATVPMTNLMSSPDASWIFSDVINWARKTYAGDPAFGEGGADEKVSTVDDNLFQVDANGDLVSIPWIADQTAGLTQYASNPAYKETHKLQQEIFQKYAQEWMLDPENGLIPPENQEIKYKPLTKDQYDKLSKTLPSKSGSGRGFTPTVKAQIRYGNTAQSQLKNPRYAGKPLTPYQYDVAQAEDIMYKLNGTNLTTTPNSVFDTRDKLVTQLNDSKMIGENYKKNRAGYPTFLTPTQAVTALKKKLTSSKAEASRLGVACGDCKKYEDAITQYSGLGDNQYAINIKGKGLKTMTIPDGDEEATFKFIKNQLHQYNGLFESTQSYESSFHKVK